MSGILQIEDLCVHYHKKTILKDVSFSLQRGEVAVVIGPSGGGKSTLLKSIGLIHAPSTGDMIFNNTKVFSSNSKVNKEHYQQYKRTVGMVFQELFLWPHLTVLENVTLPLRIAGNNDGNYREEKVQSLLEQLSICDLKNDRPNQLSVGQKQRCAIARTLALDPSIILLDEITSALDPELVSSILLLLQSIANDPNRTLLIVTHEMGFAKKVADKIVYLEQGKVISWGSIEELESNRKHEKALRFLDGTEQPEEDLDG